MEKDVEEMNIDLAEVYGWTNIRKVGKHPTDYIGTDPQGRDRSIPVYWNDAYTFEDLWSKLTEVKQSLFVNALLNIIMVDDYPLRYIQGGSKQVAMFLATAAQRTEAMLVAFGKRKPRE
jgi:hypothetical protein